jgi:hypothetical protein
LGFKKWSLTAHEGGKFVSPMHPPPLAPKKYSWYSFLWEAFSTPGLGQRKFRWHYREQVYSATAPPSALVTMKNKAKLSRSHPNASFSKRCVISWHQSVSAIIYVYDYCDIAITIRVTDD